MKKAKKYNISAPLAILLFVLVLLLGVTAFALGERHAPVTQLATGTQLEASRKTIIQQFLPANSIGCSNQSDPTSATDRVYVFFEYLRINRFDNRAVIRGCNNTDYLLMKNSSDRWVQTKIKLNLDKKANPLWQKACLVDDITVVDTDVSSENKSIDNQNLVECQLILKNDVDT